MNIEIYNTANSDLLPSNVNVIVIYHNTRLYRKYAFTVS